MEFGIGMFGDLGFDFQTREFQKPAKRLQELVEQVKLADELGIDLFALGEHHRDDYAVSSPEIVLAALSTVTKNIKLASGVTVLSSTDPVKIFEDFNTIDLLSNHRAEIIAGRGSFIESFPLFGYNLNDYDALFEEKLDLLLTLNKEKVVNWKGKFRAPIVNQIVYPINEKPLPVWIAVGGTPESVLRAAKMGLPIIFAIIGGMPRQFKPLIDFYKQEYLKNGHDEQKMQIGVHAHSFVSEHQAQLLNDYYPYYAAQMDRIGRSRGWGAYSQAQFQSGINPDGALFMGETNYVADKILATIELFQLNRFVAHIDVGGPNHLAQMKAIELYGDKVLPQIKKELNDKISLTHK